MPSTAPSDDLSRNHCDHCPVSDLQLSVLIGEADPSRVPLWSPHRGGDPAAELPEESRQRLDLLKRIYALLQQAAPTHARNLAKRWIFQPGILAPQSDESILEYLLAEPGLGRFNDVYIRVRQLAQANR